MDLINIAGLCHLIHHRHGDAAPGAFWEAKVEHAGAVLEDFCSPLPGGGPVQFRILLDNVDPSPACWVAGPPSSADEQAFSVSPAAMAPARRMDMAGRET
ncbi:hypothetical protein [uncultured Corynebacterium sp.]|uniref:hypothetical protein n=1 Tax=uncultured Corynebacterium sp. TaxID=159447 RepID=UPI0025E6FDA7|nr:hypothetical protein [uncultured Corynebacterium sp.]